MANKNCSSSPARHHEEGDESDGPIPIDLYVELPTEAFERAKENYQDLPEDSTITLRDLIYDEIHLNPDFFHDGDLVDAAQS